MSIRGVDAATDKHPWYHARTAGRDYLTPEDITKAIEAGGTEHDIWKAALQAIEARAAEDVTCCAFVALKMGQITRKDA